MMAQKQQQDRANLQYSKMRGHIQHTMWVHISIHILLFKRAFFLSLFFFFLFLYLVFFISICLSFTFFFSHFLLSFFLCFLEIRTFFGKDALNWTKVTVNKCIMLRKICISNKHCHIVRILKNKNHFSQNVKSHFIILFNLKICYF